MLQASNEKQETVSHHGKCSIAKKLLLQARSKPTTKQRTTNVMEQTPVESPPWIHKDAGHK
jgi:hypothetical protein